MDADRQWSGIEMADAGTRETTGAFLVLLEEGEVESGMAALQRAAGIEEPAAARASE